MRKNPSLIIAAGKGCFTKCRGCYQYFGKTMVSTNDLLAFISKYKEAFNLEKITLAGGDPMTRADIIYLVDELYNMNLEIYMDTVGKNFVVPSEIIFHDKGIANYVDSSVFAKKISKIGIPLDGYVTEQINHFRMNLTLEEIIVILSTLDNNNFDICINTVVNKMNINDLKKISNILKQFKNVTQWQLFQYSPIGDLGFKNKHLFEIDDLLFRDKIIELIENEKNTNIEIEGKSNSYRKMNYILVNSDGEVWQPKYSVIKSSFQTEDATSDKIIIGTIYDDNIIDKIGMFLDNINDNIEKINTPFTKIIKK